MGVSAIIGSVLLTGGQRIAQVEGQKKMEKEAKQMQADAQAKLLADKRARDAEEQKNLTMQVQKKNQASQVSSSKAANYTRGGTLLTSPLGVTGTATTAGKTLLGT